MTSLNIDPVNLVICWQTWPLSCKLLLLHLSSWLTSFTCMLFLPAVKSDLYRTDCHREQHRFTETVIPHLNLCQNIVIYCHMYIWTGLNCFIPKFCTSKTFIFLSHPISLKILLNERKEMRQDIELIGRGCKISNSLKISI